MKYLVTKIHSYVLPHCGSYIQGNEVYYVYPIKNKTELLLFKGCGLLLDTAREALNFLLTREKPEKAPEIVGCLCWFWEDGEEPSLSILSEIDNGYYVDRENVAWKNCRAVDPSEVKFLRRKKC